MKYARLERERRFLVEGDVPPAVEVRSIEDRYVEGSQLRVRKVVSEGEVVLKLGKQEDIEFGVKRVVTIYLSSAEYELLVSLPGTTVSKVRSICFHGQEAWAVDEYSDGLRIAEREGVILNLPKWVGREITGESAWSGAALSQRARYFSPDNAEGG